jgi:hypothetical protein
MTGELLANSIPDGMLKTLRPEEMKSDEEADDLS